MSGSSKCSPFSIHKGSQVKQCTWEGEKTIIMIVISSLTFNLKSCYYFSKKQNRLYLLLSSVPIPFAITPVLPYSKTQKWVSPMRYMLYVISLLKTLQQRKRDISYRTKSQNLMMGLGTVPSPMSLFFLSSQSPAIPWTLEPQGSCTGCGLTRTSSCTLHFFMSAQISPFHWGRYWSSHLKLQHPYSLPHWVFLHGTLTSYVCLTYVFCLLSFFPHVLLYKLHKDKDFVYFVYWCSPKGLELWWSSKHICWIEESSQIQNLKSWSFSTKR